ncbi:M3 family metallopeptidase [Bacteroidota bacterium]
MDYYSRKNKDASLSCTYINNHKGPFIFVNFNGTQHDITSFVHEFGHAYQFYSCKDLKIQDYIVPIAEAMELPSLCLEFLTLPWKNLFFDEETMKSIFII